MINSVFNEFEFLKNYFENYFKSEKRFPQSIVFESSDCFSSYFFAIEIARILNCLKDAASDCNCTNCKWIKENAHPQIISVTPIDFKPDDDSSKTVISVKQIEKITSIINETTDNHRFFIFSNAKIAPYSETVEKTYKNFLNAGYSINKEDWQPLPLNRKIMQDESSNALLKSVEEAPDKTTFIFLTNTKDNIISTIVSRSLVFKMNKKPVVSNLEVGEFLEKYPDINIEEGLNLSEKVLNFISQEGLDSLDVLNSMQNYLLEVIKNNSSDFNLIKLVEIDIKRLEAAKKQIMASITPKNVFEGLFIDISIEGRKLL